jgi:hypothetical protein
MLDSFEEFKTAIRTSLRDKVAERIDTERDHISNILLRAKSQQESDHESQSNAELN